jgi:hypothetical protein
MVQVVSRLTVGVERERDLDRRPFVLGAPYGDRASESLDAVAQPDEPRSARRIRAADAVIARDDVQDPVG